MRKTSPRTRAEISSRNVARFRLQRHHLLEGAPVGAVTISRDVCGVQAQVMSAAYLQLWVRNHELTRGEIESALWKDRTLVKTSLMRQTLHLIPSDELPVYISALRACRRAGALRVMERCGIGAEEAEEIVQATLRVLANGPCGRAEVVAALRPKASKAARFWIENSWGLVRVPVADGLVCYGSGENNKANFIRVDHWLPKLKMKLLPTAEAQGALLRQYLHAYGPATINDFGHWAGIPMGELRQLRPTDDPEIAEVTFDDRKCLLLREDLDALNQDRKQPPSVRLLPLFDVFLLAHRDKAHLLSAQHYKRVYRNQGWISPVVLINGAIAGVWSYKLQNKKLLVEVDSFTSLPRAQRTAIEREAAHLGRFFGAAAEVRII
jgi:Winged helix DNA-binding domain